MTTRVRTWALAVLLAAGGGHAPKGVAQSMVALEGPEDSVRSVAFSPDGRLLASGSGGFKAMLQDPSPGAAVVWLSVGESYPRVLLGGHKDGVSCVAFSPDGVILATASFDSTVNLWDVSKWRRIATMPHRGGAVMSMAFSPDGKLLATGGWGGNAADSVHEVKLWETRTHALLATLKGHKDGVTSVAFAPDGRRLATGSMDGTVRVWSVASRKEETVLRMSGEQWVNSVAFSPDGAMLASGSQFLMGKKPGKITLSRCDGWDTAAIADGPGGPVLCVAFSPDGKTLASCGEGGVIALWDVDGLERQRTFKVQADTTIHAIAFSPDGKRLASGIAEGKVGVWNLQDTGQAKTQPAPGNE